MKTINYELAKKLYDAGVVIESEYQWFYGNWSSRKDILGNPVLNNLGVVNTYKDSLHIAPPAPNVEEVIEFLNTLSLVFERPNNYTKKVYNFVIALCQDCGYVVSLKYENNFLFEVDGKTLLEAIEATLKYLLNNKYIGNQN